MADVLSLQIASRLNKPQVRPGSTGPYPLPLSPGGGSAASYVTVATSASAWTYGAWVQIVASTSAALFVEAVALATTTGGLEGQVQIGVGGAGSEAVVATVPIYVSTAAGPMPLIPLVHYPAVAASTRIAVRALVGSAGAVNFLVKLQCIDQVGAQ